MTSRPLFHEYVFANVQDATRGREAIYSRFGTNMFIDRMGLSIFVPTRIPPDGVLDAVRSAGLSVGGPVHK